MSNQRTLDAILAMGRFQVAQEAARKDTIERQRRVWAKKPGNVRTDEIRPLPEDRA